MTLSYTMWLQVTPSDSKLLDVTPSGWAVSDTHALYIDHVRDDSDYKFYCDYNWLQDSKFLLMFWHSHNIRHCVRDDNSKLTVNVLFTNCSLDCCCPSGTMPVVSVIQLFLVNVKLINTQTVFCNVFLFV